MTGAALDRIGAGMNDGDPVVAGKLGLEHSLERLAASAWLEERVRIGLGDGDLGIGHRHLRQRRLDRERVYAAQLHQRFIGRGADHQPRAQFADGGKTGWQHQVLERGLAPPWQAVPAEHDAPLQARGSGRLLSVEAGGGGFGPRCAGITRLSRPSSIQARLASALRIAAAICIQATLAPSQEMLNLWTITVRQLADADLAHVVTVCSSRLPTMR